MQKPTERCTSCGAARGPEDTTHVSYCRDCWRAKQREYREKNGPRAPQDRCSRCKRDRGESSHPNYCRDCWRAKRREAYERTGRTFSKACAVCRKAREADDRAHGSYCRECWRGYLRERAYGITKAQFEAMLAAQDHVCAICKSNGTNGRTGRTLHVDHDHITGRNRKLLCDNCNLGIGNFLDDPALLRRAADYLEAAASV
jgi:hypothetical protein